MNITPPHDTLPIWTIYFDTSDFPGVYTVRIQLMRRGLVYHLNDSIQVDTLEEARGLVPSGKVRIPPDPDDHPTVVEAWL